MTTMPLSMKNTATTPNYAVPTTAALKTAPATTIYFEDTIVDGSPYRMTFKSPSGDDFDMTMVFVPNDPGPPAHPSYNVLAFTNSTDASKIFKYSGNDTSLEGLYYLWNRNAGMYWDRVESDAKNIVGKSQQYTSVLGLFDLHFLDNGNQFHIFAPPNFDEVVYISDENEGECKENCFPLRIGNAEELGLDENLYTFSLNAE